jgi:hypothetical protein
MMLPMLFILLITIALSILGLASWLFYYVLQGRFVLIKSKDLELRGRLYGTTNNYEPAAAILFLSGWNPGKQPWTISDFYAGFLSKKNNFICLTIALRGMGSEGNINPNLTMRKLR